MMGDLNGDGDQDLYFRSGQFYDNIGGREKPIFKHISHIPVYSTSRFFDLDNDGRADSFLRGNRLINNGLEPVIGIAAGQYGLLDQIIIAVNRASQVQLYRCHLGGRCGWLTVLPRTAKEIRLAVGNFKRDENFNYDPDETALAFIDEHDIVHLNIYDHNLNLISQGQGGSAHSITMSAGQLDSDSEDEVAITFVQENGLVTTAAVNFDMSIIGVSQLGQGKHPSVAVGNFSSASSSYVMSYVTPDNRLKIATIQGDGTIISQHDAGVASEAKVSKANFSPTTPTDEYVISTRQTDGTVGLKWFSAKGDELNQLSGVTAEQPTVISRYSKTKESLGLAGSIILADKKPAVVFLDNQGRYLATGIGGKKAKVATVVDGVDGSAALVYVDEDGLPRWEVFNSDGTKVE
jgi:hypothetical protein